MTDDNRDPLVSFRCPQALKERLEDDAIRNRRSTSAQIVWYLEHAIPQKTDEATP